MCIQLNHFAVHLKHCISTIFQKKNRNRFKDMENNLVVSSEEREVGKRQDKGMGLRGTNTMCKICKQQGYVVQQRKLQPLSCNNF